MSDVTSGVSRRQVGAMLLAGSALTACAPRAALGGIGAAPTTDAGTATVASNAASRQARALYDRIFDQMMLENPTGATSLGLDTGARAALRGQLAPSDAAHRFGSLPTIARFGPELSRIDAAALPPVERSWLATVRWYADRANEIMRARFGGSDGYPIPYTITQLTGSYQEVPDFLASTHPVANASDAEAYLSRVAAMARNVDQEVARGREELRMGIVPPRWQLAKTITQTEALMAQRGANSGIARKLAEKASAAGLDGAAWGARAGALVDGPLAAALGRQRALLADMTRATGENVGVSRLPDGREFYENALRFHIASDLTPEQAHQRGLEEVADYQARMEPLLRGLGLTAGTTGARLLQLGARPDQLFPNTDAGRAEVLAYLNQRNEAMRAMLPRVFNNVPPARMEIRRVPVEIELGAPRGYAQRGSLDGSRPGAFYINLRDTHIWPKFSLPTFVYHEGIPGHVYQGAVLLASGDTPNLLRTLGMAAYGEGWGLYAEQIADELGVYEGDAPGRIGYLQAALYRACRVVVDTGMHALGWSRERAITYMNDVTGLAAAATENEIDRYIVWPGQACSYKLGHTAIVRAREAARAQMGSRFDMKAFHDVLLLPGARPMDVLAADIAAWAARG